MGNQDLFLCACGRDIVIVSNKGNTVLEMKMAE